MASGQQGDPDGLFVVIVRRRCVDYLRREYGRHHGSPRRRIRRVQLPADVAEHQPSLTFETLVAGVAVDRRERELLLLLDAGWLLREIGARWGVTESAVCRMRRRIARRTDFEAVLR